MKYKSAPQKCQSVHANFINTRILVFMNSVT